MKHLILVNPVGRRRKKKHMKIRNRRRRRSVSVRRRARRNPPGKHHSAAMRAKIGRAVKRAMAGKRRSGGSTRRRRRRVTTVRALAIRRPFRRRRRSTSHVTIIRSRRRSGGLVRRRRSRRSGGVRGFGGGGRELIKGTGITRQIVSVAGGVIAGSFLSSWVMRQFSTQLAPLQATLLGRVATSVAIPTLGAIFVRRINRDLSNGMLIAGIVSGINQLIVGMGRPGAPLGDYGDEDEGYSGPADMASETYMDSDDVEGAGEYFDKDPDFNSDGVYSSTPAFDQGGWG